MKNLIIGISVGLVVGIGGTLLLYQPGGEDNRAQETVSARGESIIKSNSTRGNDSPVRRAVKTDAANTLSEGAELPAVQPSTKRDVAETVPPITPGGPTESAYSPSGRRSTSPVTVPASTRSLMN